MSKKKLFNKQKFVFKVALIFSIGVLVFSLATSKVLAVVTIVSPSNMQGWVFEINSPDGFGTFVTGPATPPLGVGSARLFTGTNGNLSIALHNVSYENIKLSDITKLEHSAFGATQNVDNVSQPFMYIVVQTDGGQDTLKFNPNSQSTSAVFNSWQSWNTKDDGVWGANLKPTDGTLAEYISFMTNNYGPNITINEIKFQVGSASQPDVFDGNVDNFTIGINGGDITFDFEPDVLVLPSPSVSPGPILPGIPTNKDQCKNGGWNTFRNPSFKNQGDCIKFVK